MSSERGHIAGEGETEVMWAINRSRMRYYTSPPCSPRDYQRVYPYFILTCFILTCFSINILSNLLFFLVLSSTYYYYYLIVIVLLLSYYHYFLPARTIWSILVLKHYIIIIITIIIICILLRVYTYDCVYNLAYTLCG